MFALDPLTLLNTLQPLLTTLLGAGGTLLAQRLRRPQAVADAAKTAAEADRTSAEADKAAAEALSARFSFYETQLRWAFDRINALETRYATLQDELAAEREELAAKREELAAWKLAVGQEPDGGERIRSRLPARFGGGLQETVFTGPVTIQGPVVGGDVGTVTAAAPARS